MSQCRSCNAPLIWWVNTATGKKIPLDAMAGDLALDDGKDWGVDLKAGEILKGTWVSDEGAIHASERAVVIVQAHKSHFLTCPDAQKYSGRNR